MLKNIFLDIFCSELSTVVIDTAGSNVPHFFLSVAIVHGKNKGIHTNCFCFQFIIIMAFQVSEYKSLHLMFCEDIRTSVY